VVHEIPGVASLPRHRRPRHRRAGMLSPAKACWHGLLGQSWPPPPSAPVSSRGALAAAHRVESAPGRGQRGHGKCWRKWWVS